MIAVYEIVCSANGRRYVGSSVDVAHRWSQHKQYLRADTHHNYKLQRAWTKHGAAAFAFRVLEEVGAAQLFDVARGASSYQRRAPRQHIQTGQEGFARRV